MPLVDDINWKLGICLFLLSESVFCSILSLTLFGVYFMLNVTSVDLCSGEMEKKK